MSEIKKLDECSLERSSSASIPSQTEGEVDAIVLAFCLLIEVADTVAQSANIQAKSLDHNARSQQILNNEGARLQWYYVPRLEVRYHSLTKKYSHKHAIVTPNGVETWTTKSCKVITWTTNPNAAQVNNAEAKNQRVVAMRQTISDQLSILQQNAQMQETHVNTLTDESMQSLQMGTGILDILLDLTFQALLRKPPQ